jgi:hypothetical protein
MLFSLCSQMLADCDDLDCKLSTSDDYLNEQEEELRHRVQLEAEERKLEETLEYQRRIEEEAKQKHLAEQCRSTYASSVTGTPCLSSTGNQDNHESALNNSSRTYLEGIKFGDFRYTENNFSQKLNGLDSSDAQALTSSDMSVSKLTLKMNGVWKNAQPIKSLSNHGTQNSKRSSSEPQNKYFQGCGLCTVLSFFLSILLTILKCITICFLLQVCQVLFMMIMTMIGHQGHNLVRKLLDGAALVK